MVHGGHDGELGLTVALPVRMTSIVFNHSMCWLALDIMSGRPTKSAQIPLQAKVKISGVVSSRVVTIKLRTTPRPSVPQAMY